MGDAATIRNDTTWARAAFVALAVHLVWFGADVIHGGFRNLDVAGIAYNARLLLDGDLPYVASWEMKPPGAFFLFAALLAFGSMHTVWAVAVLWGAATSLAVGLLAGRLWGRRFVLPAVALHAGSVLLPTQADINYVFWATLPFVLAAAMAFAPAGSIRHHRLHWFSVGAIAAVAVLFKQPMVGLLAVLGLGVLFHAGEGHVPKLRAIAFGTLGAAAVFAALFVPWLLAGETRALIAGLGLRGGWWVDYSTSQAEVMGGVGAALLAGTIDIGKTIQIGSVAALLGLPGVFARGAAEQRRKASLAAVVFLVASFAGMAVKLGV